MVTLPETSVRFKEVKLTDYSYSVTLLSRIIQPTKVAPIRTFHELSGAVQSGDHKLYAMETQIPFLLDSLEDDLKALGRMKGKRRSATGRLRRQTLLQIVLEAQRIQYEIVVSKDISFGKALPDGNFTGMIGMVQRGEADLAGGYLIMNEVRSKAIDFSIRYLLEETTFRTPMPGNNKSNLALLQVFDGTTQLKSHRLGHELSRTVQSGDHKLYAMETPIPFFLDSGKDDLKNLGRMFVLNNWVIS
ncbi:hypothetical protein CEXT_65851 [Caerostris extrusa]|uniref:Ionotropic glutamate receptor L-glutamate and glycine-binding domain-containing protein n=1 Tax=Caerostris extrusa TaxID=172846 RepID=A0AAV4TGS7_CAEEX|nr:hypothetical protein CEXT_65851 [Caerostris extrusa]